ncbi:hypothetical protein ABZ835_43105 [Streptomyces sp. NPDC047461]
MPATLPSNRSLSEPMRAVPSRVMLNPALVIALCDTSRSNHLGGVRPLL